MVDYNIQYGILDYNSFYKRLNNLCLNGENSYSVYKEPPLGKSKCGFNIEHFRIGNGPIKLVYAGGLKGDELIGVDFIITLMENIAKGNGLFKDFDPNVYTLHFLPCLNPEGFFTTTYALKSVTKKMNDSELEKFCSMYQVAFQQDDENVLVINKCIEEVLKSDNNTGDFNRLSNLFWRMYGSSDITFNTLLDFLSINSHCENVEECINNVLNKWKVNRNFVISSIKWRYRLFNNIGLDCIPLIDNKHNNLKNSLLDLYRRCNAPLETLACFNANGSGVDLDKNNILSYNEMFNLRNKQSVVYGYGRNNDLLVSEPGPLGAPNYSMDEEFREEPEIKALSRFMNGLDDCNLFMFCGGSGNALYVYPYDLDSIINLDDKTKKMIYFSNSKLATTYANQFGNSIEKFTKKNKPCKVSSYIGNIDGYKNVIRNKSNSTMLLQISSFGGNPIAPYKDKEVYIYNMICHLNANKRLMSSIIRLDRLTDMSIDDVNKSL